MLLQRGDEAVGFALLACRQEDDGRTRLARYGAIRQIAAYLRQEVILRLAVRIGQLFAGQGYEVEVLHKVVGQGRYLAALLFGFQHRAVSHQRTVVQIAEGGLLHGLCVGRKSFSRQLWQANKQFGHVTGDVEATRHAFVPTPRTVGALQLLQFGQGRKVAVVQLVEVEQRGYPAALFALGGGFEHPGRLGQKDVLHFLILL